MNKNITPKDFQSSVRDTLNLSNSEVRKINKDWNLVMDTEKIYTLFSSFDQQIQEAIRPWVIELTEGMKEFIERYEHTEGLRIQTEEELEGYCYYVAGTVGHLLASIIGVYYGIEVTEEIHTAAEKYGVLLQFVNISKDVYNDYTEENNIYLPMEKLKNEGVSNPSGVIKTEKSDSIGNVVLDVLDSAEQYFSDARTFLRWFQDITKHDGFVGYALPYLLSIATIRDLRKNSDLAAEPEEEVKIPKQEVFEIASELIEVENVDIEEFEQLILSGEFNPKIE